MHRTHIALALLALALAAGRALADGDPPAGPSPPRMPVEGVIDYPVPANASAPMLHPPDPVRTIAGFALEHGLAALAIGAVLFGCLGVHVANRRGLPAAEGLVCGALFWPLGVLVVLLLPPGKGQGA